MRVPLGVVAIVYEARPNVTVDAAALAIKSGNAVVLRGSSTAARSNAVLAQIVAEAGEAAGLPEGSVSLVAGGGRDELAELARQDGLVDLIIPRGGEGLKKRFEGERDRARDLRGRRQLPRLSRRERRSRDGEGDRLQREGPAAGGVQRRRDAPGAFRDRARGPPPSSSQLLRDAGVELVVDGRTRALAGPDGELLGEATDEDWDTEYLGLKMAVKTVDGVEEAIDHVNRHGTGHSEAIVTEDERRGRGLHRERRRGLRLRQRLDALHRRRRVRHGRGDGQLDPEAPRPRPDRPARADDVQVRGARQRPGARVVPRAAR